MNTSVGIHSRGWTSSFISPNPPAFLGCKVPGGLEGMLLWRRWATGSLEVLFNKQSPLTGLFRQKIRFRQRLAYLSLSMWGLRSVPVFFYCLLPAYSLLHNSRLFPEGICIRLTLVTLVGMHCLYTLWKFTSPGFSVPSWYDSVCGSLFGIFDIILKLLGISKTVFTVTTKTMPETKSRGVDPYSGKFNNEGLPYFLPGTFIMLVNLAALADILVEPPRWSRSDKRVGSGLNEACGCIFVAMLFLPFLKGLFKKGKYGIPLSIISKAAFLAVLFVVFSGGKVVY